MELDRLPQIKEPHMPLFIRKLLIVALVAAVFLIANALAIAYWLSESGAVEFAAFIRREFLTGTAITILLALLLLLTRQPCASGRPHRTCGVCDGQLAGGAYCPHCGSKT